MPWTSSEEGTLPSLKNKSKELRQLFAEVANTALADGRSEDEAITAGLAAVANKERKLKKAVEPTRIAPSVPEHVRLVLESARKASKSPSETISKQGAIHTAFLGKNALEADPERSLVNASWDNQGRLILTFSDGKRIITDPVPVSENIEQYVTITSKPSESTGSATNLDALADVQISAPQDGDMLVYQASTSTWVNKPNSSSDDEVNPQFQYDAQGNVSRIDYASGNYKEFTYTSGFLTRLDYVRGTRIFRKNYTYNAQQQLVSIEDLVL